MSKTKIQELSDFGQSIWLDYISRSLIQSGQLRDWIEKGVRGMTSNPTIFDQAISSSSDYDEKISQLAVSGKNTFEIYDDLTINDIQEAADFFRPIYDQTNGLDGFVSLEIDPRLANKTDESVREGLRLFRKVDRPNLMIKVPATKPGIPVVEELISQGINVNVTLIFSLGQYEDAAHAYLKGMEKLSKKERNLMRIKSVASVFVSRIDTAVDNLIAEKLKSEGDETRAGQLRSLQGKAAVANAHFIFEKFNNIFSGNMFRILSEQHADIQRVLWASTGTKNPSYSDIKYITELIAKPTVNTLPEKTLCAFLDHGAFKEANLGDLTEAKAVLGGLLDFGINIDEVCDKLLVKGVESFEQSFLKLLSSIESKARKLCLK